MFQVLACILNAKRAKIIDICSPAKKTYDVSVDSSNIISTWDLISKESNMSKCRVELVACSSCVILVKIWLLELSKMGEPPDDMKNLEKSCDGDRLEIIEPLHRALIKRLFCPIHDGNNTVTRFTYRSQTKSMAINFHHHRNYSHPFTLEYTIKRNIKNFEITPEADSFENTVTSPFFPVHYPSDFRAQYNIKCSSRIKESCRIRIFFLDFQIAPQSLLEFFENRSERIGITTGRVFRPPIIISNGRTLSINFFANKASSFGFKFNYTAVIGEDYSISSKPETSCGGNVDDVGGTIVMTKMTPEFETVAYDCIWLIKPLQRNYFKSHLMLKIISFFDMENRSTLEIHRGLTSGHEKAKYISFQDDLNSSVIHEELIGNINMGFYIYLHGIFSSRSRFIISYSAFSVSNFHEVENFDKPVGIPVVADVCYLASDFLCHNQRCIVGHLRCDGFDHCGDNSDELQCVNRIEEEYNHRRNYYFPKTETFSYIPSGLIFAFLATASMFLLCSLICTLVYRTQQPYELNRAIGTLNQMIAEHTPRNNSNEIAPNQELPPRYESPPNYQEIMEMQIFLGNQTKSGSKKSKRLYNQSSCRECRSNKSVECSSFLIKSREEESPPNSSSEEESYDPAKLILEKRSALEKGIYTKNSFGSTISNDSLVIIKKYRPKGISNKSKLRTARLEDKMRSLLSKSANNLTRNRSDDSYRVRLAKSVEGLTIPS